MSYDDTIRSVPIAIRPSAVPQASRRPYAPPRLDVLGDLRGLTYGGSPGFNDSGSEMTQQPPGGGP